MRSSEIDPNPSPYEKVMARRTRTKWRDWILVLIALALVAGFSLMRRDDGPMKTHAPAETRQAAQP